MFVRFFPTDAKTAEDHEAANVIADILVGMHQKGEIQKAFKDIYGREWQRYLPMAIAMLEFGRAKSETCANHLLLTIRNELKSNEFTCSEADAALCELNNMEHMNAKAAVPAAFTRYANKVGYHFGDGWVSLGKAYIQFRAAANSNREIIQLVDAEIRKHQQPVVGRRLA